MLNQVFFISESLASFKGGLPDETNLFFSVLADAARKDQLENAYDFFNLQTTPRFALSLSVREIPSAETIRAITSFLFLPVYLRNNYSPVITLAGDRADLLAQTNSMLQSYLSSQGLENITVHTVSLSENNNPAMNDCIFSSSEAMVNYYRHILTTDPFYDRKIFFRVEAADALHPVVSSLRQVEAEFKQKNPSLYRLAENKLLMDQKTAELQRLQGLTEDELNNQKQYVVILRSDHATRELQDYYNNEYEVLPRWFKRFGHLIKAINGKRSFKSLFSKRPKKYND